MMCPDSEKETDNIVRNLEGEFGEGVGSVLIQKEHGSERVATSGSNVERKC